MRRKAGVAKAVVTGGNGFIGRHVVYELLSRGFEVVTYDVTSEDKIIGAPQLQCFHGDIRDIERLNLSLSDASFVFHLAGILGTDELFETPREAIDINIGGALNVLLASIDSKPPPRIFLPTKRNEWNNIYSVTAQSVAKLGHAYRENAGLDVRVLSLPNVYGPHQKLFPVRKAVPLFIVQALRNRPLEIFGDGTQPVELVFVEDAAKSIVDYTLCEGPVLATFKLETKKMMSVDELARLIITMTDSCSRIVHLAKRRGESGGVSVSDCQDVQELIGPQCQRSIDDGLRTTIDWYKQLPLDVIVGAEHFYLGGGNEWVAKAQS